MKYLFDIYSHGCLVSVKHFMYLLCLYQLTFWVVSVSDDRFHLKLFSKI